MLLCCECVLGFAVHTTCSLARDSVLCAVVTLENNRWLNFRLVHGAFRLRVDTVLFWSLRCGVHLQDLVVTNTCKLLACGTKGNTPHLVGLWVMCGACVCGAVMT